MTDHVDSEVYDAHQAFETSKTKMKMLVPLYMNGQKMLNTNYDLKFGDLFKVIKCYVRPRKVKEVYLGYLKTKSAEYSSSFSVPVVIRAITIFNQRKFDKKAYVSINPGGLGFQRIISLDNLPSQQSSLSAVCTDLPMFCIFNYRKR